MNVFRRQDDSEQNAAAMWAEFLEGGLMTTQGQMTTERSGETTDPSSNENAPFQVDIGIGSLC